MSIPNPYPNIADKEINDIKTWSSAKIINELQPALDTEIHSENTYEGNIVTFNNLNNKEITSLDCEILPIQEGTGDPSPSNPRPISGTSVLNVEQRGKNRVNFGGTEIASNYDPADPIPFEDGYIIKGKTGNSGYIRPSTTNYSITGDAITVQASLAHYGVGFVIKVEPTQTITVSLASGSKYGVNFYDNTKKYMSSLSYYTEEHTFTIPSGAYWLIVVLVPNNLNTDETFVKVQAELGNVATTYEPYTGSTYTVNLGQTVYGGTADVVGGSGKSEWGYIASYNGETITEPWFSSIDAYAEGTPPSIGAEVVYKLATPTNFTFTGVTVESLEGVNNIWRDTGDIKVTTVETETIGNILKERGILP